MTVPNNSIDQQSKDKDYDFFISHAGEDKDEFVRPLTEELLDIGAKVWYDEFTFKVGDSLSKEISKGLTKSKYGIVVLSEHFFEKSEAWPGWELRGLVAMHNSSVNRILPVWHGVSKDKVIDYDPSLADLYALETSNMSIRQIAESLIARLNDEIDPLVQLSHQSGHNSSLKRFCDSAFERWKQLVRHLPEKSPSRFPNGYYEMGFAPVNAQFVSTLLDIRNQLSKARQIKLSGWTPFLEMDVDDLRSYAYGDFIEAWLGNPIHEKWFKEDPSVCDYWRASKDGMLYTIRGYCEDGPKEPLVGKAIYVNLPVLRVGEALLFATRFFESLPNVNQIAIQCRFTGLEGRHLVWQPKSHNLDSHTNRVCRTNQVILTGMVALKKFRDDPTNTLHSLLSPLYEQFDLFDLKPNLVEKEFSLMVKNRF